MRMTLKTTIVAGILAVGGLLALTSSAQAGCGGGGRAARGQSFGRGYAVQGQCGGGCNMAVMNMGAMPMSNMPMQGASMQGMNMNGPVAPAAQPAAAGAYFCPMHPGVVSAGPATCPYCAMALKRR